MLTPRSEKTIARLTLPTQDAARRFFDVAQAFLRNRDVTIDIISGLRDYAEQKVLFAQGRNGNPGPIVTKAPPGHSMHNFGLAFDIGLFRGGKYLENSPIYRTLGPMGAQFGLTWGGYWKGIVDEPHYERRPDWGMHLSAQEFLAECRSRHDKGISIE
jgi:peptidoglycan LD-endopeptidase CwlK